MLLLLSTLVFLVLLGLIWVGQRVASLAKYQAATGTFIETELKEVKAAREESPTPLAYGWYDDGWPVAKCNEEDRAPLENPTPQRSPDEYATQMYVLEYKSIQDTYQRKKFLRQLRDEAAWMEPELLDIIYADESAFIRAWAASHLETDYIDYTDDKKPREVRNYEPALLQDSDPIVRAALWSNPKYHRLPWDNFLGEASKGWREQLQNISQLERLGLMRNPELSMRFIVTLLDTPSEELNMTRKEHANVLCAAATNPKIVGSSRFTGRIGWVGGGEGNPPFKEYGTMWTLCLDKWTDESRVPYLFFKYIQTTPEVKLAIYTRLLEKAEDQWLRAEVIRSCDPFDDGPVLKMAWNDPDENCREIARERIGGLTEFVGVQETQTH